MWSHDGNLWLFGGAANIVTLEATTLIAYLRNDIWMYEISSKQWYWIDGPNSHSHSGTPGSYPAARRNESTTVDGLNNLWVFGGETNTTGILFLFINFLFFI